MSLLNTDRRQFLRGSGAFAATLSLKYAVPAAHVQDVFDQSYGIWEDIMR